MEFYKEAAEDFSRTRTAIWPGVMNFLNNIDPKLTILDAGCGNGKNMMKTSHNFIGLDSCNELLDIVRSKVQKLNKTNILNLINASVTDLPFSDDTFDAVMSVAVVHHIEQFADRVKAFKELIRVCKPNGRILITVWQMEDNPTYLEGLDFEDSSDELELSDNSAPNSEKQFMGDKLIRWKHQDIKKGLTIGEIFRFYHFYSVDEINYMIRYCEDKFNVKGSYFEEKYNYYIEFKKF